MHYSNECLLVLYKHVSSYNVLICEWAITVHSIQQQCVVSDTYVCNVYTTL